MSMKPNICLHLILTHNQAGWTEFIVFPVLHGMESNTEAASE